MGRSVEKGEGGAGESACTETNGRTRGIVFFAGFNVMMLVILLITIFIISTTGEVHETHYWLEERVLHLHYVLRLVFFCFFTSTRHPRCPRFSVNSSRG